MRVRWMKSGAIVTFEDKLVGGEKQTRKTLATTYGISGSV